jgi:hypothetical protein
MKSNYKTFHYFSTEVTTGLGETMQGFKYPVGNPTDEKNISYFFNYFGINQVLNKLNTLIKNAGPKTERIYTMMFNSIKADYIRCADSVLRIASDMCWTPTNAAGNVFTYELEPEEALNRLRPMVEGILLGIQEKMNVRFPEQIMKNLARVEIQKEILDVKENIVKIRG